MYTKFLLFFFQIFKVYSMQVSSSSVAGLCLFAKGEVKNLSNPVGLVCLPYVMWSAHFFDTHTDGKDKLLEWPDRSYLLLYVSARIH